MKNSHMVFVLLVLGIVFVCGCTENPPLITSEPVKESPTTPATPPITTIPTGVMPPDAGKDPFVGTWECKSYLASGPLKKEYTFLENGTWTRTNTNLDSMAQAFSHGTWKKESDGNYVIHSSITGGTADFEYDSVKDELYNPGFKETFHRVPEEQLLRTQVPTLNIAVYSAQKYSKIQGATPNAGREFLLINISIENINEQGGFSLENKNILVLCDDSYGGGSITQKVKDLIENPIVPGVIGLGEIRKGNVVFAIPEDTISCWIKIVNNEGDTVSDTVQVQNIQTVES